MLRKLLKYDLKSGLRTFSFVWLGIAVLTGLVCLIFALGNTDSPVFVAFGMIGLIPLILSIIGATLFSNIFVALRFYRGLLGKEGYLMFSLPAAPWKLLTSKLISAMIFVGGTTILSLTGLGVILRSVFGTLGVDLGWLLESLGMELSLSSAAVITILNQLMTILAGILQIYVACCLGHLCRSKRGLWSVIFYFAINTVISLLVSVVQTIFMVSGTDVMSLVTEGALYYTMPLNGGLSLLFFFVCEKILRTKLNLE